MIAPNGRHIIIAAACAGDSRATQNSLEFAWPDRDSSDSYQCSNSDRLRSIPQEHTDTMGYGPPENIQISLANGNIMKIPLASINISEEVNKTGIWQQVNEGNEKSKQSKSLIK